MNVLMNVLNRILFARKTSTFFTMGELDRNFQAKKPTIVPISRIRKKTKIRPRL